MEQGKSATARVRDLTQISQIAYAHRNLVVGIIIQYSVYALIPILFLLSQDSDHILLYVVQALLVLIAFVFWVRVSLQTGRLAGLLNPMPIATLMGILALAPIANLVVLRSLNQQSRKILNDAGIPLGLLGADRAWIRQMVAIDDDELQKRLASIGSALNVNMVMLLVMVFLIVSLDFGEGGAALYIVGSVLMTILGYIFFSLPSCFVLVSRSRGLWRVLGIRYRVLILLSFAPHALLISIVGLLSKFIFDWTLF